MAKIGGGSPSTIWMRNFMACKCTTNLIDILNINKKYIERENPTKRVGPGVQEIVKNKI